MAPGEIPAWAATPRDVAREVILMLSIAPQSELGVGLEEKIVVTESGLSAEDSIVGTGAEREIMPMDSARRRSGNFHFVELLLNPVGVAGGKLYSGDQNGRRGEIRLGCFHVGRFRVAEIEMRAATFFDTEKNVLGEEGNIAQAAFGAAVDRKTFGAFERTID